MRDVTSVRISCRKQRVQLRQENNPLLIATRCVHNEPCARVAPFVGGCMGNVGWQIYLVTLAQDDTILQTASVEDAALPFQQVRDGFDTLVVVDLCAGPGRHRKDIHADLFCANGLC